MTILYQTWKTKSLPSDYQKNWNKWDQWCRKHKITHILLDDQGLRNLVRDYYPTYLQFYDSMTENIERVDFARMVMMSQGGVYADLDTYPSDKNDPIKYVNINRIVLGCEPKEHSRVLYQREKVICNAFMISPSSHLSKEFWEEAMKFVVDNYERYYKPVENTGPMALTKLYETHPEVYTNAKVLITEPCVFYPLIAQGRVSEECDGFNNSYVVHEWTNSWSFKFWKDPIWKNTRHKTYIILVFLGVLILLAARPRR